MNTLKTVLTVILLTSLMQSAQAGSLGYAAACGVREILLSELFAQRVADDVLILEQLQSKITNLQEIDLIIQEEERRVITQEITVLLQEMIRMERRDTREEAQRQAYINSTDQNGNLDEQALYKNLVKAGQADIIPRLRKEFDAQRAATHSDFQRELSLLRRIRELETKSTAAQPPNEDEQRNTEAKTVGDTLAP